MKWRVFIGAFLNFTNRTATFNIQGSVVIRTRLCIDLRDTFYENSCFCLAKCQWIIIHASYNDNVFAKTQNSYIIIYTCRSRF